MSPSNRLTPAAPGRTPRPSARAVLAAAGLVAAGALAGCSASGGGGKAGDESVGRLTTSAAATSSRAAVPEVTPRADADCPYLPAAEVERLNGEKVSRVRIDDQVSPPSCFFYASDAKVQLTVSLYTVDSERTAQDLVDRTVPVRTSERADVGDWTGGKTGGPGGSILAVTRGEKVLAVQSDQEQSIKVQRVAEAVLPRVGG